MRSLDARGHHLSLINYKDEMISRTLRASSGTQPKRSHFL